MENKQRVIVTCSALTKDYGSHNGLFDCTLEITEGEIFGLIGPNGAGKSTLIKLLMDLVKPTSGFSSILGLDSQKDSLILKKLIGYLPGEMMQFPGVTAGYILELLMNMRGLNNKNEMYKLSERLQLDLSRKFQDLSHGNKQKVMLVQAFMHKPKLLILDEPTLGLDPIIQRELKLMMEEYVHLGNSIILSSHVLSEIESVCNRIALINKGKIVRVGSLDELRSTRIHKVTAIIEGRMPKLSDLESQNTEAVSLGEKAITFQIRGSFDPVLKLLSQYQVVEFDSRELSLEEVFFSEVGVY